jgi:hypothetical protein
VASPPFFFFFLNVGVLFFKRWWLIGNQIGLAVHLLGFDHKLIIPLPGPTSGIGDDGLFFTCLDGIVSFL